MTRASLPGSPKLDVPFSGAMKVGAKGARHGNPGFALVGLAFVVAAAISLKAPPSRARLVLRVIVGIVGVIALAWVAWYLFIVLIFRDFTF